MADETAEAPEEKKKGGMMPMLLALVATIAMGGGGFFVSYSGVFPPAPVVEDAKGEDQEETETPELLALPDVVFVQLDPILVTLAGPGNSRYLRFGAQLEVPSAAQEEVTTLMPRILDILNGYLRALNLEDVQKPTALLTLRAHMLRRVELVVGEGRVHDLLVTEFVVN